MEINRLSGLPQPPLEESDLNRNVGLPGASPQPPPSGPPGPAAGSIQGPAASGPASALQDNSFQSSLMQLNLNQQLHAQEGPSAGGPFGSAAVLPGQTTGMSAGPVAFGPGGQSPADPAFSSPAGHVGPFGGAPAGPPAGGPGLASLGPQVGPFGGVPAGPTAIGPATPSSAMTGGPAAGAPAGPAMGGPAFSSPSFGSNLPPLGIPIPGAPQGPDPDEPGNTPQVSLDYDIK